ncbi:WD repeat-containing protein [Ooceraea biroi]|uniref:WD repeat-containing protein n=1 Tax=Ooceraea biroi TaxID=2015173 RepID=A0A026W1G5_OOCBI|nr:WD repeat-containing protein [Ooceraea biroi]
MNRAITRTPCWVRGGKVEEIIWIGKDVLAWCSSLYIVFFHVVKRQETLRWCWNNGTGDGARCVSGHVSAPVFAFAERSLNPRILVHVYPSMAKVSECPPACESGYLAIAFTPHEYLVSLGSYPSFPLIVWCWRTGGKIAIVDTPVRDEVGQRIKITPSDHEVRLPREAHAYGIDWCPGMSEPLLAITDREGHIYLSNYDGSDVRRVVLSQRCGVCEEIEMPAVCWFRGGIILRTTFCQIRYFRRKPRTDTWHKEWYVKSIYKPHILVAHPVRSDWLFYYTLEGYLMQIVFPGEATATPVIYRHLHCGGTYRFVDFVRPWCHHLVVTDDLKNLTVLESYGGSEVAKMELDMEGVMSAQALHPDDPLIVVVSDQGEMILVGITDPEKPTILARFRLQRKPLDIVKFSQSGRFVIAAHKETGNCYCINVRRDKPWGVIAQVQTRRRLADVMLHDDGTERRGHLKVLALFVKYEWCSAVGQEIFVYDVSRSDRPVIDEADDVSITLPALFRDLCHAPGDASRLLIGSPYLKRQLHVLRLQRDFKNADLVDAMLTGHHVHLARIFTDRRWIVTCAYDGLVIVRDETVSRVVIVMPAHHRLDSGSTKAIINREGDMIVALGHDGSLVAVRVRANRKKIEASSPTIEIESVYRVDHGYYQKQRQEILADYASLDPAIRDSLTRAKQELPVSDKTWEEWQQDLQLQREEKMYATQKAAIMRDLAALKDTVKRLLDVNETLPEIERLPVSAFDLDRVGRDQKLKAAKDEREEVRMELECLCESMDGVAAWIKSTFWDTQVVLGRSIFSFSGDTEVTNYPALEEDPYFKDHLQWAQFNRDAERAIIRGDTFQSWRAYTDEQLRMELSKPVTVYREDEKRRMDVLLEEEEREVDPEELAELRALDGMTTHQFVEQSLHYYPQMDSYGFAHATLEDRYLMHDCNELRAYFNKLFDDTYAAKEREMAAIREKNEKIRHIDSELKLMFGENVPQLPIDPEWHPKEKVESIIQVEEREIKAKPYVSPSQQEVLEKQAEEAERVRRQLLADDFRERALMQMMDGVLEIRWEDTIKVDVRKPACMLEKQPEKYTAQDIVAVKKYEAEVEILRQERERYKRLIEADYVKVSALRQEGIGKFDTKVNELFQLKLKIDAAINQLKLRHIRGRLRNLERIKAVKEDDQVKCEISEKRQRGTVLEEQVQQLHDVYQDMLAQHDALCTREKTIAKKLQHDFAILSKSNFEVLERQYKRRPKVSLKNIVACDLVNLAGYLDQVKPTYLPAECMDYLKILDSLDARPNELPQSIDAVHWNHLVRLRRQKIDVELRIRARQLEIAALERTIGVFEGKIDACKSSVIQLRERLKCAREARITREQDQEVQLVLKRGQVEIAMQGERRDAANAVLIPRSEILKLNEHIRAAGARKLDALKRLIDFRHKLAAAEWEHRCLRTRYLDLEEDLRFLKDVTVTRDMKMYLKRKAKGLRGDKTALQFEEQVETAKSSLEKALSREMNKLKNIQEKIARTKKKNAELDRAIMEMNVKRWELEYERDLDQEAQQSEDTKRRMRLFRQRAELIRKVQENYAELLTLQTEHELLRMRTYPTFDYFETLNDEQSDKVCQ